VTLRRLAGALLVALAGALASAHAPAAEPGGPTFSGFATLGAVTTDRKDVWFTRYGVNYPGDSDPDFSPDSLLGLQASLPLGAASDVTLQTLVREDGSERYDPRLTLAFFRHALAPGLTLRVGRLRVPFFMLSDSLYVNYANPWVRPPVEVYGLNPFNDLDGVDLLYHLRLGGLDLELHPYYGSGDVPFPEGRARLRETWGLNAVLSYGSLSLHLGHGDGRFTMQRGDAQFRQFVGILQAAGAGSVIAELSGTRGTTSFDSVGAQWDDGRWQLVAEYVQRRANRYVVSAHGWYLSAGRRFGALTPYLVLARQQTDRPMARLPDNVPQAIVPVWQAFLTSRNNAQRSITAGLRWDFARNAALKGELARARPDGDAWGSYFPRSDPLTTRVGSRTMHTLSVSLDLTF